MATEAETHPRRQAALREITPHLDHITFMQVLLRRCTEGNDACHFRAALTDLRQTGDIDSYVSRFLLRQTRVPDMSDAEARFALVRGFKLEV